MDITHDAFEAGARAMVDFDWHKQDDHILNNRWLAKQHLARQQFAAGLRTLGITVPEEWVDTLNRNQTRPDSLTWSTR